MCSGWNPAAPRVCNAGQFDWHMLPADLGQEGKTRLAKALKCKHELLS